MSDKRKIRVVKTYSEQIEEFYMKIQEVEKKLKEAGFIRCHQSYLVNTDQIVCLDGNTLVVQGDESIPLSRRYRKEVIYSLENKN